MDTVRSRQLLKSLIKGHDCISALRRHSGTGMIHRLPLVASSVGIFAPGKRRVYRSRLQTRSPSAGIRGSSGLRWANFKGVRPYTPQVNDTCEPHC